MTAKERQDLILETIMQEGMIKISRIATSYNVTIETARKDIITLQDRGLVVRISGGAILNPQKTTVKPMAKDHFFEKNAVAKKAAKMVSDGQTIFMDTGSTIQLMAKYLKPRHYLTIITYSLTVLEELMYTDNKIIVLGGELRSDEQILSGHETEKALSKYYVDQSFLSCIGVSFEEGITDLSYVIDRKLLRKHSDKMVLLADSSKWGIHSKVFVGPISMVDSVVVDSNLSQETIEEIKHMGLELITAPVEENTDIDE